LTSKIINTPKILLLFISLLLTLVPAASAEYGHAYPDKPDSNNNLNDRYFVSPVGKISPDTDDYYAYSETSYKLGKGEIKHLSSQKLGSKIHWLEVDLRWKVSSNPLVLKINSPSGIFLGIFHDNSDGKTDGKIHLSIFPSEGYIEEGKWIFEINGESAYETQSCVFNLYGH
jgi:hypothetical protein